MQSSRIALTGGIACGKSLFAKFLRELGIQFIDADDVVHELEAVGGAAVEPIVERFGAGVRAADGGIDRTALATVAFGDVAARRDLEAILHPRVRARLLDFVDGRDGTAADVSAPMRVAVIPLLFESHFDGDYDIILCIASPVELQLSRMEFTRGYTRAQAEARLAAQMPAAEKAARADWVVVNDGTPEQLKTAAERTVEWLNERLKDEHRRRSEDGGRDRPCRKYDAGSRGSPPSGSSAQEKTCC